MAGAPDWKVYNSQKEYKAACKDVEDAAALVVIYGDGATIRYGHKVSDIVWTEGAESFSASESYDGVAAVAIERVNESRRKWKARNAAAVANAEAQWQAEKKGFQTTAEKRGA